MALDNIQVIPTAGTSPFQPLRQPLEYLGSLDQYHKIDSTPIIGSEFPNLQLTEILHDEEKLRDLAILVSQRGVIIFRNQKISIDQQKLLTNKLGELTGRPETSKLHKHILVNAQIGELVNDSNGLPDDEVALITSKVSKGLLPKLQGTKRPQAKPFLNPSRLTPSNHIAAEFWHSESICYENIPADYAVMQMLENPPSGGDTLFASGYEVYDRMSRPMRSMLETLTAVHSEENLVRDAPKGYNFDIIGARGSPSNVGFDLTVTHPLVRTNPVTGWKSLYGVAPRVKRGGIQGVTKHESDILYQYIHSLVAQNHDLQVRVKWNNNDIGIWDNRSTYHVETNDFNEYRRGYRTLSVGEKPYFDPASKSRREALASAT
ncbi:unnamed protein product [Clonostachys chloroleuca]|uniref:TauD/TfdA-like domain-containing protein n=1 Tax=Clonostachys chloroleuca TaxID=1926264 RepID=A0AA35M4X1_9HYPO|nr:unnamed protein product [Clonostachys chloroleuca]